MKPAKDAVKAVRSVYVYEVPVRIWHWVTVAAMIVLIATGIFIGTPFFSVAEGKNDIGFLMGYIRFAHFSAGYIFTVAFIGRAYWAFVGNEHAKQLFMPPFHKITWWSEVFFEFRWYLFLEDKPKQYVGHNPLALFMMFCVFVLGSIVMIATGFALYSEAMGEGHWSYFAFHWVITLFHNSQDVHTLHHLTMWGMICFIMVHVYAAIREDIMSRQSIIGAMFNGWRIFRD